MNLKIGLSLAYKATNYGTLLQAFSLQYILEQYGATTEIIDYHPKWDKGLIFSPESIIFIIFKKLSKKKKKREEMVDTLHEKNMIMREQVAKKFIHNRLKNIIEIIGYRNLKAKAGEYDCVIVGSDQLWLPEVSFTYFRTLRFVPRGIKRVSYATSLGVDKYPWYVRRLAGRFLKEMDSISVREEQGKKIIRSVSGRDAKVVLDPTYLLDKKKWEKIIPCEKVVTGSYYLCYFLGDNPGMKSKIRFYANKYHMKIVAILSNEVNVDDSFYADKILIGQSPEQFVNLIRNAECIFTDSFHGFAFSVINEKKVYVTYRDRKGKESRNSRINNIIDKLGLEERLVTNYDEFEYEDKAIDYADVNSRIDILRKESIKFLEQSLGIVQD